MNYTEFKQSMKVYKPSYIKEQAEKKIEPFIYAMEEYEGSINNVLHILIFDNAFYMSSFLYDNTIKYSLVLSNRDYYDEDLDKLIQILYNYVEEYVGFPSSNNTKDDFKNYCKFCKDRIYQKGFCDSHCRRYYEEDKKNK
jgi:hypothetical protein